jgi:hypothetical protein
LRPIAIKSEKRNKYFYIKKQGNLNLTALANRTSQHILSTSSNLLGICLFVITSLHIGDKSNNSLIDEFTAIIALLLTISSVLSFFSIRTPNIKKKYQLETIGDKFFIVSLFGIFAIIIFIIITYWGK